MQLIYLLLICWFFYWLTDRDFKWKKKYENRSQGFDPEHHSNDNYNYLE